MQQTTVLQVIPGLETGGAERTTIDIGNALVRRGWTSLVASAGGRMVGELRAGGSEHIHLPLDSKNPVTILLNARRLIRIIRERKVRIIHARSRAPAWSAWIASRKTGIPFVTTYHGSYTQNSWLKAYYNSVMARADVVIANSNWTADLIEERNPWASERIQVVHRGTNLAEFAPSSVSPDRQEIIRRQWGINTSDIVVVHLARLTSWKGQMVLIDAAAKLISDYPALKVILAGDTQGRQSYQDQLTTRISEHGLEHCVRMPGHCDDPATAVSLADIVVVASTQAEAFGRAATEAGALERPVVVTNIGAVGETVLARGDVSEETYTGWKVAPGDAAALAAAMRECLQLPPAERRAMGERARAHVVENFSLEQMCEKTLTIYQQLLE